MAKFYIVVPDRIVYYKYAVEAESLDEAQKAWAESGDGEYVGYIDGTGMTLSRTDVDEYWDDNDWVEG